MTFKPRYYHYHFDDGSHITECDIEDENRIVQSIGFAICSPKDPFCRKRGRLIAIGRAAKAFNHNKNSCPITRENTKAIRALKSMNEVDFKAISLVKQLPVILSDKS